MQPPETWRAGSSSRSTFSSISACASPGGRVPAAAKRRQQLSCQLGPPGTRGRLWEGLCVRGRGTSSLLTHCRQSSRACRELWGLVLCWPKSRVHSVFLLVPSWLKLTLQVTKNRIQSFRDYGIALFDEAKGLVQENLIFQGRSKKSILRPISNAEDCVIQNNVLLSFKKR